MLHLTDVLPLFLLHGSFEEKIAYLKEQLRADENFDIIYRCFLIGNRSACVYFIDGLVKDEIMQKLLQYFGDTKPEDVPEDAYEMLSAVLNTTVSTKPSLDPRIALSFSGSLTLLAGYVRQSIAITSLYPSRVNQKLLDTITKKIESIQVDSLTMNQESLAEKL